MLVISDYYCTRFASDVKEINITCEEKVYYTLSKVDNNGNNIIVGETIPDTADEERYCSIIKSCGNIKD